MGSNMIGAYTVFCNVRNLTKYSHRKYSQNKSCNSTNCGNNASGTENSLMLINVLFRHGHRIADSWELYPNDPHKNVDHFPYSGGGLTAEGKERLYSVGRALRSTYNDFLGEYYYPNIVQAISSDYHRTKMSLLLVLAGLFPPRKEDMLQDDMYWQPVPFNYVSRTEDRLFLGQLNSRYSELYEAYCASPKMQDEYKAHKETFDYIAKHTGLKITRFLDVYNLYFGLSTETELGLPLPEWTKSVWPDFVVDMSLREYQVVTATTEMRRITPGSFIKKLVEDMKNKIISTEKYGRKAYLYSGHENNISELFIVLDIFKPHIPTYGAYAVIELHKINEVYGIKIKYECHDGNGPQILKMPGCDEFCPLDKFISLIEKYLPEENVNIGSSHAIKV